MANVSVTNTFTSGTTILSGEMNTNFTDIINGTSDGTKDFNISALTASGIITFDGLTASRGVWLDTSSVLATNGLDNAQLIFGTGLDTVMKHTGTNFEIDPQNAGATTAFVINESGADVDFRIEGDTATQMFVINAGDDTVNIGTTTEGNTAIFGASSIALKRNTAITGTLSTSGAFTANGGIVLGAGDDLTGSSTSDINLNSGKFIATGADGNGTFAGTLAVTGVATLTAQPILSSLTASLAVFSDGSKGLVSNALTGTGNVVMSASPTLTGTAITAAITASGLVAVNKNLEVTAADGVRGGDWVGEFTNSELTDSQSFGVLIKAGSTSTDTALQINDHDGASLLMTVKGNGSVGIGDSAPDRLLNLKGDNIYFWIKDAGGGNTGFIGSGGANDGIMRLYDGSHVAQVEMNTNGVSYVNGAFTVGGTLGVSGGTTLIDVDIITGAATASKFHMGEVSGEGVYLASINDKNHILGFGAELVGNAFTARATVASNIQSDSTSLFFFGDTSLSDGSTYSPTARLTIDHADGDTTVNTGDFTVSAGEVFLNLPTSAGTSGSLWADSGTVKVA